MSGPCDGWHSSQLTLSGLIIANLANSERSRCSKMNSRDARDCVTTYNEYVYIHTHIHMQDHDGE